VLREGEISSGDRIEMIRVDRPSLSVAEVARLYTANRAEPELLRRACELDALAEGWRARFRERLARIEE
jgi:MOSC domain-containing protein YiiM